VLPDKEVHVNDARRPGACLRLAPNHRIRIRKPSAAWQPPWVRRLMTLVLVAAVTGCASRAGDPIAKLDVSLHDGRIIAAVRSALLSDPTLGLREIAVASCDGVVTLSGTVWTADELERATTLARGIPGVRTVIGSLTVEPPARLGGTSGP
jgi:hyperosmotically inducible protein